MRTQLLCLAGALLLASCAQPEPPLAGLEPTPNSGFVGRRKQLPLPAEKADVAVIFVGGFTEQVLLHFREVYEQMPPLFRLSETHFAATWLLDARAPIVHPPKAEKRSKRSRKNGE